MFSYRDQLSTPLVCIYRSWFSTIKASQASSLPCSLNKQICTMNLRSQCSKKNLPKTVARCTVYNWSPSDSLQESNVRIKIRNPLSKITCTTAILFAIGRRPAWQNNCYYYRFESLWSSSTFVMKALQFIIQHNSCLGPCLLQVPSALQLYPSVVFLKT